MRRVLILGGQGMLGHKLWQVAGDRGVDAWATVRRPDGPLMVPERAVAPVDAGDIDAVASAFARVRPEAVVNCIGVVKQSAVVKDPVPTLMTNAVLPHQVARLCETTGARLIHISTDCVFSGRRGKYRESDSPDAEDLYGRSKLLGEVTAPALTLRTSMIGRELAGRHGLVEWFLNEHGPVSGFRRAIFSGLTTLELARVILDVIESHPRLEGLYHVAAEPIDKYALLGRIGEAFGHRVAIEPVDEPAIDRSLDGSRFLQATQRLVPPWDRMLAELAADSGEYVKWRQT